MIFKYAWRAEKEEESLLHLQKENPAAGETLLLKLLLEPGHKCRLFVRGFVDLSATSSQNGLIRGDSSLAETFPLILTHNTKKCWALLWRFFEVLPALIPGTPPPGTVEPTRAHVKMRQIHALPNVIILFLCLLLARSLTRSCSLWVWPGGSYLCDRAAVNRAAWQTAEEPGNVKCYF